MQQELADGAARWACRTWVSGCYGHPRSWDHGRCAGECGGMAGSAINPLRSWEIMGGKLPTTWKIMGPLCSWVNMDKIVSHYFLKCRNGSCAL